MSDLESPVHLSRDHGGGQFVNGRWQPAARTVTVEMMCIEPLTAERSGSDLERIERLTGRSLAGGGLKIFWDYELRTDQPTGPNGEPATGPDWVFWRGKWHQVVDPGYWEDSLLFGSEALAVPVEPQPDPPTTP